MKFIAIILLVISGIFCLLEAKERIVNFEDELELKNWSSTNKSTFIIDKSNYKDGCSSMKFDWTRENSKLIYSNPTAFTNLSAKSSAFCLWIYNPMPIKDKPLNIEIGDIKFQYYLDFKGWRTLRFMYNNNFGKMPKPEDKLIITTPKGVKAGSLYLDFMVTNLNDDWRFYARDNQMPWNRKDGVNHWVNYYEAHNFVMDATIDKIVLTAKMQNDIAKIRELYLVKSPASNTLKQKNYEKILADVAKFEIKIDYVNNIICGVPLLGARDRLNFSRSKTISEFVTTMGDIANAYNSTENMEWKKELAQAYISLAKYFMEQGWAVGSVGNSNISHLGYVMRPLALSINIMQEELKHTKLFNDFLATVNWFNVVDDIKNPKSLANMDTFNTRLNSMIVGVLLMEDLECAKYLKALAIWLDNSIDNSTTPCGGTQHHNMIHPGYTYPAIVPLAKLNSSLYSTEFQLLPKSRDRILSAVWANYFSNYPETPRAISGRCPMVRTFDDDLIAIKSSVFIPESGSKKSYNSKLAGIYLYLFDKKDDEVAKKLKSLGAKPTPFAGFFPFQGAEAGIYHQGNAHVAMKGMNKFHRGVEFYGWTNTQNSYAKNLSNLSIQIINGVTSREENGWNINGWDYNFYPGTTSIVGEPQDNYRYYGAIHNSSPFACGVDLEAYGVFATELQLSDLRAKKSVFAFGNQLIALGSDIAAIKNSKNLDVATTLVQVNLEHAKEAVTLNGDEVKEIEKTINNDAIIYDGYGNYYIYPKQEDELKFYYGKQEMTYLLPQYYKNGEKEYEAKDYPDMQNRGKRGTPFDKNDFHATSGVFLKSYINHAAKANSSYRYFVLLNSDKNTAKNFLEKNSIEIVKVDKEVHIIRDNAKKMVGYVFFVPTKTDELIKSINRQAVVLTKEDDRQLLLAVASSDLSNRSSFEIVVRGLWSSSNKSIKVTERNGDTKLQIPYIDQLGQKIKLIRK